MYVCIRNINLTKQLSKFKKKKKTIFNSLISHYRMLQYLYWMKKIFNEVIAKVSRNLIRITVVNISRLYVICDVRNWSIIHLRIRWSLSVKSNFCGCKSRISWYSSWRIVADAARFREILTIQLLTLVEKNPTVRLPLRSFHGCFC